MRNLTVRDMERYEIVKWNEYEDYLDHLEMMNKRKFDMDSEVHFEREPRRTR